MLCLAELQLKSDWSVEPDSPPFDNWGTCKITPGTLTTPMKAEFQPVKRPQGQLWPNVYILHRNAYNPATQFAYTISIEFPTQQDINNCNAPELDFQINDGQTIFNWGYQFLIGTGLRIWNRSVGSWVHDPVMQFPVFQPGVPLLITVVHSRSGTNVTYNGVSLNGVLTPLSNTYPAVAKPQNQYLNCAWQLDSKGQGAPVTALMNGCSVVGF